MATRVLRIHDAFRSGDLAALREAIGDPAAIPNGQMPPGIGPCLVYAIYHSPLRFIRELLELGADPNATDGDGFPPLIAAIGAARAMPGGRPHTDVDEIVRKLLEFGAEPNQRGINDYTPLHMAVAERNALAIYRLLAGGADPEVRTRIDECETPVQMAKSMGLDDIATLLTQRGQPLRKRLRPGLTLQADVPGSGELVRRLENYRLRLRLWLHHGAAIRWTTASGLLSETQLEDAGETLFTSVRIDRRSLIAGLFHGVEGMRVQGLRRLEIAPHLAYGSRGVAGTIPPGAQITAEIVVIESHLTPRRHV